MWVFLCSRPCRCSCSFLSCQVFFSFSTRFACKRTWAAASFNSSLSVCRLPAHEKGLMCNRPEQVLLSWTCLIADKVESRPQWDWVSGLTQLDEVRVGHIWELTVLWEPAVVSSVLRECLSDTQQSWWYCYISFDVTPRGQMNDLQSLETVAEFITVFCFLLCLLWLISARNCTHSCLVL